MTFPLLVLIAGINGTSWEFITLHLIMYALVVMYYFNTRDHSLVIFIVTHSFWLFSYLMFLYACVQQTAADGSLIAPIRCSVIAAVYLLACLCARIVALDDVSSGADPGIRMPDGATNMFCLLGLLFIPTRVIFGSESFWYAISVAFTQFYWLGLYFKFDRQRMRLSDPVLLSGILLCLAVSILDNRRALMFEFSLTFVLIYLRTAARAVTVPRLALAVLGSIYLARLSDIFLYGRLFVGRDRPAELLSFMMSSLLSAEFILAPFDFTGSSRFRDAINSYVSPFSSYRIATFEGRSGILERATLLPHMDTVVGVLPQSTSIDWGEIVNTILSILPSFGQDKDVNFGDRLTWLTGLRPAGSVGHPLITAAGEFFAMGGYALVFVWAFLLFSILFLELRLVTRLFKNRSIATLFVFTQAFYMMFSSTAISATAVVIRQIPFLVCIYLTMMFLLFAKRGTSVQGMPRS